MKDNLFIKASIKDGELHFPIKATGTRFKKFLSQLPDDSKLEIFIGVSGDKGSNPQLARIHAMIREIAQEIGYTFVDFCIMLFSWEVRDLEPSCLLHISSILLEMRLHTKTQPA